MTVLAIAAMTLAIWVYLLAGRGAFWLAAERDDRPAPTPAAWPRVIAVIPARNEAEGVGETVTSLLRQNYRGTFAVVLVDDNSTDGTGAVAQKAAAAIGQDGRLTVVTGAPLAAGWTGKLWAVHQGVERAMAGNPDYLLLTDADIVYAPDALPWLAAHASATGSVLTSLMAKLRCETLAERSHVPAFIFFFQMLYPFGWVNRAGPTAAAAGGCMLVKADALRRAGGIAAIRGALIDDCALASLMKAQGPIWLSLTERVRSIRPYRTLADVWHMVSRSAYAQLRYSPLLLAGTGVGMALTYLAPPLLAAFAPGLARWLGIAAWALMALAFQPTLRFYRLSPLWGVALPVVALMFMIYTLDSGVQYMRGRGGAWKGRIQANVGR